MSDFNFNGQQWDCTDPDDLQFSRFVGPKCYHFKQIHEGCSHHMLHGGYPQTVTETVFNYAFLWHTAIIDLNKYTVDEMWEAVKYYYPREQFDELLAESQYDIIAECIFENSLGS